MQVQSLGQEDPLEEGMVAHPSILAWRVQGQRSLPVCSAQGCTDSDMTKVPEHARTHRNSICQVTVMPSLGCFLNALSNFSNAFAYPPQ